MKRLLASRVAIALVAVVMTATVVGGIAYAASTPPQNPVDGNGLIHACYNVKSGAMKLKTKDCAKSSSEITWTQTPPAPQPPVVYQHNDVIDGATALGAVPNFTTLATLNLPAGTYDFRAVISLNGSGAYQVVCDIPLVNDKFADLNDHGQVILEGSRTVDAGQEIVRCAATIGSAAGTATFTATPITLNGQ